MVIKPLHLAAPGDRVTFVMHGHKFVGTIAGCTAEPGSKPKVRIRMPGGAPLWAIPWDAVVEVRDR